jgi:hypothetical protein
MRKLCICLCLFAVVTSFGFAQNALWAGNAARGNDDSFPASIRSSGKSAGISLALPEGTLVQVKNQKNGLTQDITIVKGQGKPGIFILLNSAASDALEIRAGEVIMVEIEEKKAVSNPFLDYSADPDSFKKNLNEEFVASPAEDPDNTAAVDVTGEMERLGYGDEEVVNGEEPGLAEELPPVVPDKPPVVAVEEEDEPVEATEPVAEESVIEAPPVTDDREYEDIIIADGSETYDSELDYTPEETVPEEAPAEAFLSDSITIPAEKAEEPVITEEPASVAVAAEEAADEPAAPAEPDSETPAEPVIDPGRVIYFLAPAELRPPEPVEEAPVLTTWDENAAESDSAIGDEAGSETEAEEEKAPSDDVLVLNAESPSEEAITFVPQYVESDELKAFMKETLDAGSRYVQVASFGRESLDDIYNNMVSLQEAFPYLPLLLLPGDGGKTFKLMVGPVSRDEVGILIYAMKARGFSRAFLSRE